MRTLGSLLIITGLVLSLAVLVSSITGTGGQPVAIFLWLGVALLGWVVRVISKWEKTLERR